MNQALRTAHVPDAPATVTAHVRGPRGHADPCGTRHTRHERTPGTSGTSGTQYGRQRGTRATQPGRHAGHAAWA
ncbi:hypothetical protein, partial [Micromonospora rifamycinica]|uniref:hypothetical protein n=1 Tax=Micromonospora rifamycinica TaxID=291594 RepID=UPI001E4D0BBE